MGELRTAYDNQVAAIESIREAFKDNLIPCFTVDANRKINIVTHVVNKRLEKFIDDRESLFERVYPIKQGTAAKLIEFGYNKLSRFGRWCPVKVFSNT